MKNISTNVKNVFKKRLKLFLFSLACIITASSAFSQTKLIQGKVTTPQGEGMPGVNILVKGTNTGGTTDASGNYTINNVPESATTLIFSFIGFVSQEVEIGNQSSINISLVEDAKQLNEVVVTAYGIKKDARIVGFATQEVKGEDLIKAREPNTINSLTGKVAGLSIGSSPELLGRPNIVLRGNTDVLFVVNGIPINSDTWNISADDIETYTVLKGPNASALYGFRGQNGAIVITTKSGKKGTDKNWNIDFNSSTMIESGFLVFPKNNEEYGRGTGFAYSYGDGIYDFGPLSTVGNQRLPEWGPHFDGQLVKQYDSPYNATTNTRTPTPYLARGKNNLKNFLTPGVLSTNNLSFSSAGDKYDVRISATHSYQKGLVPNTKLSIENINLLAGFDLTSKLRLDGNINLNVQHTPNIPDVAYGPNSYVYMFGVYGSDDYDVRDLKDYYKGPSGISGVQQYNFEYGRLNNPYFMAHEWKRGHQKTDIIGSLKLTYKINDDLNLSLRTQVTAWSQTRTEKVPAGTGLNTYLPWWSNDVVNGIYKGDYRIDQRNLTENNSDLLLNYNKKISNWSLSALLGGSARIFNYGSSFTTTRNLNIAGDYNLNNTTSALAYTFNSRMNVFSGFYSVDLGYKNFFNISTTGRVDNLSTLPSGKNTFFYPSVAVSSAVSDYVNLPEAISFLKVRASFAEVKSALTQSQAPSAYAFLTGKTLNSGLLGYGSELYTSYDGPSYANQNLYTSQTYWNNTPSVSFSNTLANPDIKPFKVTSYEAGLDIRFFKNRLGLDVTYFQNLNGPSITPLPIEPATGFYSKNQNALTTQKKGWEVSIKGTPIKSDNFSWDVLVNWSTFKERLYEIGQGLQTYTLNGHNYKVGDRLDAFYSTAFIRDGQGNIVFNSSGAPLPTPGGVNNNKFLGNLNPDYSFGINNKFIYKSISLSFQFDGRVGGKIYDRNWYQMMNGGTALETVQGDLGDARLKEWKSTNNGTVAPTPSYVGKGVVITGGTPVLKNGEITNLSELTFAPNTTMQTVQSYLSSSVGGNFDEAYMIDRTYVKLREVNISYRLPLSIFGKSGSFIRSASISLVARNLLYFAARKDFDIDQYASGYNATSRSLTGTPGSVDLSSPTTRRYGININLSF